LLGASFATSAMAARHNDTGKGWDYIKASFVRKKCQRTPVAPTISGLPTLSLTEGENYQFTPHAADANCDSLTFSISGKPAWASFNAADGTLSGQPPRSSAGSYPAITISVSDGVYQTSLARFGITVYANVPPILSGTPSGKAVSGQRYSFLPIAFNPDGQTLTFGIRNRPTWASFDSATGALSGTPSDSQVGTYSDISITATDGVDSASMVPFAIVVEPGNRAPSIYGTPPGSVVTGQAYSFTPSASDPDGDPLTFSISNRPAWATFDAATGSLSGTPGEVAAGEYVGIVIRASDGKATSSLSSFGIVVSIANRAPSIAGVPDAAVTAGQPYLFVPKASDADGDALTFSIANKPAWAAFSVATGALTGTPGPESAGVYSNIRIGVSDGSVSTSLPLFAVTVDQASMGSATLSWQPPTQRTDGTPLTDLAGYRILYGNSSGNYPNRVTVDNPGLTSYVIENLAQGTWYFVMTAFDASGAESDYSSVGSKTIQ
jgi:hypothetical protein